MPKIPPHSRSSSALITAILVAMQASSALAVGTRFPVVSPAGDDSSQTRRTAKGDFRHGRVAGTVNPTDLWATSEPKTGKDEGTATDKLYASLKTLGLSLQKEIVVAVIDSGVDIDHEDLQGQIWVNAGETGTDAQGRDKATNGIDDDGDGFVDDVHGWNFLGGVKNGKIQNVGPNSLEVARELGRMERLAATRELNTDEKAYLAELTADYAQKRMIYRGVNIDKNYNGSEIIGDQPEKLEAVCASASMKGNRDCVKTSYGNNDVKGTQTDPAKANFGKVMDSHGTHVSGIIAALRDNVGADGKPVGLQGQATKVKIMAIRAVPDGDERDKDIANGIRFAVDHGAKIINGSFGKSFSPHKDWVDSAVRYAASKGVLFVHAAGNSGASNEGSGSDELRRLGNFPNQYQYNADGELVATAPNWIEVGASGRSTKSLVAYFSNYGKKSVNLFAPGVRIGSSVPEKDQYEAESGTSMASPEVAGVSALLWSLFPNASASQIRTALLKTTTQYSGLTVERPKSENDDTGGGEVLFSELSEAGGIVNAYQAALYLKSTVKAPAPKLTVKPSAQSSTQARND